MECNGADIMARKEDFIDKSNDKSIQKEEKSSTVINHGSPRDKIAAREVTIGTNLDPPKNPNTCGNCTS